VRAEEDPEEEPDQEARAGQGLLPTVAAPSREFEFRTELLTDAEMTDGKTLADRLNAASREGWDLVEVIGVRDVYAVLLRRPRSRERESRPVGFAPPPN
jgi:hypothetical protein